MAGAGYLLRIYKRESLALVLLDTNILIEILKNNRQTIATLESFEANFAISSVSAMELFYGAFNKAEIDKLEKFITLFHLIHIDDEISKRATLLVKKYAKSHSLDIPDSLITATALEKGLPLFTYNKKDFRFIDGLTLS